MDLAEYERIQPNTVVDGMMFYLPNRHCEWRVQTMYTKEPDTVEWIRSMQPNEIFYDIGANIGLYTMLAIRQGLRVYAFEPESQNFAVLIRNLAMNKTSKDRCIAFPFCISNTECVETLRLSSLIAGGSCHSFASNANFKREEKEWAYEQGSVGFSMDSLVYDIGLPCPDHIKIDVDGFEDKVLLGASRVLTKASSVLVEMDSQNSFHMEWKNELLQKGFEVDEQQVAKARRAEGAFAGIGNIIFKRAITHPVGAPSNPQDASADGVSASVREDVDSGHADGAAMSSVRDDGATS